jgi:hypothetical protein
MAVLKLERSLAMKTSSRKTNKIARRSPAPQLNLTTMFDRLPEVAKTPLRMLKTRWEVLKVRRVLAGLRRDGMRVLKLHPVSSVVGAFVGGVALTKLASRI